MTEKEKQLIDIYLPHKRDESLGEDEYYTLTATDRVEKGYLSDLAINSQGENIYRIRNKRGVIYGYASDSLGYMKMSYLYDNKKDCKNSTHSNCDYWEDLRKLQQTGGKQ